MKTLPLFVSTAFILAGCVGDNPAADTKPAAKTPAPVTAENVVRAARAQPARRVHPDSSNWRTLFDLDLANAEFEQGVWFINDEGDLTANKDSAIWSNRDYQNFILDFEYKLDPGANSGCLVYCVNKKNWIPGTVEVQLLDDNAVQPGKMNGTERNGGLYGHLAPKVNNAKPAGEWNRMTVWAVGKRIRVAVNGEVTVDADLSVWKDAKKNPDGSDIPSWLSVPWSQIPTHGRIGFQGRHGKAAPYFRFIRVKEL
ncbi:MAG: DUF1080 domain-containing protein [Kiritimatiellae bacterium]|nr:DUF1080 domain-containing protein [Kiritimatiellia bacterium]